jgi:YozE SAM-like protein
VSARPDAASSPAPPTATSAATAAHEGAPAHEAAARALVELLAVVEAEWPKLRDPRHPQHEPAPSAGRRLRVAAAKARQVVDARPAPPAEPETFPTWLERQAGRCDPVGRLATAAQGDESFPPTGAFLEYREHLLVVGGSESALRALEQAWREYEGEVHP